MDDLAASLFISPAGTRHYASGRKRFGLPLTECGVGVDFARGWDRGTGRQGSGVKDCQRCEDAMDKEGR